MKTLLLSFLLASTLPAQISAYGYPQFGYNGSQQLVTIDCIGTGNPVQAGFIQTDSPNYGAAAVFVAVGLTPTFVQFPNGNQLVNTIVNTVPAPWNPGLGMFTAVTLVPNTPAVVGVNLFFQMGHLFTSHYALSNGIQAVIQ